MSRKKNEQEPPEPISSYQRMLNRYEERVRSSIDSIMTTDKVSKIGKAFLEKFVVRHSELFGKDLTLFTRRCYYPEDAVDLQFENRDKEMTMVKLKLGTIGKEDLDSFRKCMQLRPTGKKVYGIVVCKDVSPTILDELRKRQDIQVFCFGWKLFIYPKQWD